MRTSFGIACAIMAANAYAFDWATFKHIALNATLGEHYESHPVYQFHGTDRRHVREHRRSNQRTLPPLSLHHRHKAIAARHSMMDRRERLGMARVGFASPNVGQEYSELNNFSGFVLNVLQGMSYTKGGNSKCYDASEDIVIGFDTFGDVLRKIYIPAYQPEFQVQVQDITAMSAAWYVDCSLDKFFLNLTHLASEEGLSEISSRVVGAYFFEIAAAQKVWNNPEDYSAKERGETYGTALSIILNYTI